MSTKKISIVEVILWICVVLLILLSLTPFALGYKVKSDYTKLIDDLAQVLQIDLEIQHYDQGFFSSDAIIAIKLPNMPEQLQFKEEIIHGPLYLGLLTQGRSPLVVAVVNGKLDVTESQQDMVQQIFAGQNPLVYQNVVAFSGDVDSQAYIPAIDTTIEDEFGPMSIFSAGIVINEKFSMANGQITGEAQVPSLKIQSAVFNLNAQSFTLSFSGQMGQNDIMLGDSVASMALLDIDSVEDQFAIRDLTIRSVTTENGSLINSGTQISAREILASNQRLGPVKFNLSLNGIDAPSLSQIQEIQKEVEAKLEQGIPPEQVNAMMTGQIMQLVPNLIKQAEIKVNPLSIGSELGKLEADMELLLEGIDENTPADPMFLLGAISLELNLSIDEQLLKQLISWELENSQNADMYMGSEKSRQVESDISMDQKVNENLQGMLDENWLVTNEGVYISKISMHQGELLINGKPVDPMQQIMSSMGQGAPATP